MKAITFNRPDTKECPFCGEIIQARAIKCRFCAEFLNSREARDLEAKLNSQDDETVDEDDILFCGRPSLMGLAGSAIRAAFFLSIAVFLIVYPLENLFQSQPETVETYQPTETTASDITAPGLAEDTASAESKFALTEQQSLIFAKYRHFTGIGLMILVLLILLMKIIKLKMTYYEVTAERIEWSRGIFDRRIDNIDMFRVVDLRLRRSLLDCIFGIGTVSLITTDKTDPQFEFEKVTKPRRLYDAVKKASLEADRRDSVVHLE